MDFEHLKKYMPEKNKSFIGSLILGILGGTFASLSFNFIFIFGGKNNIISNPTKSEMPNKSVVAKRVVLSSFTLVSGDLHVASEKPKRIAVFDLSMFGHIKAESMIGRIIATGHGHPGRYPGAQKEGYRIVRLKQSGGKSLGDDKFDVILDEKISPHRDNPLGRTFVSKEFNLDKDHEYALEIFSDHNGSTFRCFTLEILEVLE